MSDYPEPPRTEWGGLPVLSEADDPEDYRDIHGLVQDEEGWKQLQEKVLETGEYAERPEVGPFDGAKFHATDINVVFVWDADVADWNALNTGTSENPVPGASHYESVKTEDSESTRSQSNEFSAELIRDVYRADEAIPLSGVAQSPVQNIGDQGLRTIEIRKGVAYLTDRTHFIAYDVSNPLETSELDRIDNVPEIDDGDGTGVNDIEIYGTLAYLSNRKANRLTIVDIGDPTNLEIVSSVELSEGSNLYGLTYRESDETIYMSGRDSQSVTSLDVSAPENPVELDHISDSILNAASDVDVIDDEYLTVACRDSDAIVTLDASNPGNLSIVDSVQDDDLLKNTEEVIVHRRGVDRDVAYSIGGQLSDESDTFAIIDISDPTDISIRSSAQDDMLGGSVAATLQGNYLYIGRRKSGDDGGAIGFDVSDPDNPVKFDHNSVWGQAHDVDASDDLVYGADPSNGIWVSGANQFLTPEGTESGKELLRKISTGRVSSSSTISETIENVPRHDDVYIEFEILTLNANDSHTAANLELTVEGMSDGDYDYETVDEALEISSHSDENYYALITTNGSGHRWSGKFEWWWGAARKNITGVARNTVGTNYDHIHRVTDLGTADSDPDMTLEFDVDMNSELIVAIWAVDRSGLN